MSEYYLRLKQVTRAFQQGDQTIEVLKSVNFDLKPGEIVGLVGHSGAGKTTLLQICGLLEAPTTGEVVVLDKECATLNDRERTALRRNHLGFVYQFHHLLPEFTALENVIMPQIINRTDKQQAREGARDLLAKLGLSHRIKHLPSQLSGGEQQRVAIARALANKPKILLADEPTGNLDDTTGGKVFEEMMALVRNSGLSALVATHNLELASRMDRVVSLKNGCL